MYLPKAAAGVIIALLALGSTSRATPSQTSILPSTTVAGTAIYGVPEPAGRDPKVGLNETTTEPVTTPSDGASRAADPVPVSASQATKPSSDGSTTTILLSIAVGLAASVGAAIVIVSRRRSAQFQQEMNVASGKDHGIAIIDLPEKYDHDDSDDQFSVHGLTTRGGSAYVAHGDFATSSIRSSNILVPRPYQQPPVSTPTRTMEDGVSYVDESLLGHTEHPHLLRVVDSDSPVDEDAMIVLCTMTGGDSMRCLDTAHLLQSINSNVPLASTTESDTYIVGDDDDDDMSEYDM